MSALPPSDAAWLRAAVRKIEKRFDPTTMKRWSIVQQHHRPERLAIVVMVIPDDAGEPWDDEHCWQPPDETFQGP